MNEMNELIPPCCLGKIKYLGYSEDPYPLSMKDVNLSYLLSFNYLSSLIFWTQIYSSSQFCRLDLPVWRARRSSKAELLST